MVRSIFTPVFKPIKNYTKNIYSAFSHRVEVLGEYAEKGSEILTNQNKYLVNVANQVEPLKREFNSTKEMFKYAKERCISTLRCENPHEYTVVMDIKQNKVLAEYVGDSNHCTLKNLRDLSINSKDTVLMHSHPKSYPISRTDVITLLDNDINQVIAIDVNGQYSLVAKRADVPCAKMKSKELEHFTNESLANADDCFNLSNKEIIKEMTHYTLRTHADSLGIRYSTNYGYLLKQNLL